VNTPDATVVRLNDRREQQLIGALLVSPELVLPLGATAEDFGDPMASGLMALMRARLLDFTGADIIALQADLFSGQLDVSEHFPAGTTAQAVGAWLLNAEQHAAPMERAGPILRDLRRHSGRRQLEQGLTNALTQLRTGQTHDAVLATVLSAAQDAKRGQEASVTTPADMSGEREGEWERRETSGTRLRVLLPAIDRHQHIGGLTFKGVTLALARSGMGKTSTANRLALGVAAQGVPVYLHGTETTRSARLWDMACSIAGMTQGKLDRLARVRGQSAQAWEDYASAKACVDAALDWLETLPLHLSGCDKTVEDVFADVVDRRFSGQLGYPGTPALVIVDYLQDLNVIPSMRRRSSDKGAHVRHASKRLKELQTHKSVQVPLLVFAQVSGEKGEKAWDARQDPRPTMTSCMWSSEVHQDAEEVLYIHREDYFEDRAQLVGKPWVPEYRRGATGAIEVGFVKRREGPLVRVDLRWDGPAKWVGGLLSDAPEPWCKR
jgi:replicative DNA helicase